MYSIWTVYTVPLYMLAGRVISKLQRGEARTREIDHTDYIDVHFAFPSVRSVL
jgi:hypothetical protein